jgi:23S rRNA (uracil1939-C5)-methyltransferase
MKSLIYKTATFDSFIVGGQSIGTLDDGKKIMAWGVLPKETASVRITKQKNTWVEGVIEELITPSLHRIKPTDPDSFLSTSPWQILAEDQEDLIKNRLVKESFLQNDIVLPDFTEVHPTTKFYNYRNKVEFSWWWSNETQQLDLAFFARGTHHKIPVDGTSLANEEINRVARAFRDVLRSRHTEARSLKTLLIRSNHSNQCIAQLYVKDADFALLRDQEITDINAAGVEVIYSNPKSPASVITKHLQQSGLPQLSDTLLETSFQYATEGFFQINLPVYGAALKRMGKWINKADSLVDLYSGVGSIGLTIGNGSKKITLVEQNPSCVEEMKRNIAKFPSLNARAILSSSEEALQYIVSDAVIAVDPPRAGLHKKVIDRLLEEQPKTILYLSCNPATQARDIKLLLDGTDYAVVDAITYNFFPRTPHIEQLIVLQR